MSNYLNFLFNFCKLAFIIYNFEWLILQLFSNLLWSKAVIFFIKTGFIREIRSNICCNRKGHCWHYIFNKINTGSVQKPGAVAAWNSPGRFLLSIRRKLVITFRYVIINRYVHKSLNYQSNVSQMERPLLNIWYNGSEVKHQI